MIGHDRSRREVLQSFRDDLGNFDWLFWNLHRERLACIDRGEDTKGVLTDVFKLKADMMKNLLGKEIRIVTRATEPV